MSYSYTDGQNNQWYIDDYGNVQGASRYPVGYSSYQDTLDSSYAYMYINGSSSNSSLTWGAATVSGNSQSVTGTVYGQNISWTRKTYVGDGFVRVLEVVQNTGAVATNVRLSLEENIYYDSNTQVVTTSSGDTTVSAADDWSAYGSSVATNPHLVRVVSGGVRSPGAASQTATDVTDTSFSLTLAAGETQVIAHFYALASNAAGSTSVGNAIANLTNPAYLTGMSAAELNALVNFTKDVSSAVTASLTYNYQMNLTLTGSAAINGTGNAKDNAITGNAANNLLTGLGGHDTLNGGGGSDTMVGGAGNDTYVVDVAGDVVTENANEGIDTVLSSVSYTIAARPYVENITLTGAAAISATGNTAGNVLDGSQNSAANTLAGGTGNDTYIVGAGDVIVEAAGSGTDTVSAAFNWVLAANLENLVLTGSANLNGTGNTVANALTGNAGRNALSGGDGNDTLDGGAGADTMTGGTGDDTFMVDNAGDVVSEAAAGGTDTVIASVNAVLSANVENLTLSGSAFRGTGNTLANRVTGNAADNLIDGAAGADTMVGLGGSDIYIVDNAGDVVTEALNGGIDTVKTSLAAYTLGANVENGAMLGAAVAMTGNGLNNFITGTRGGNTINGAGGNDSLMGGSGNDSLIGGDGNDLLVGDQGAPETQVSSAETIVNGKAVSLNLSAPEISAGSLTVSGTISSVNLGQSGVNVVYVIDRSGSMSATFSGSVDVPDMNGDGLSNTTLDAAIASLQKLNQSIIDSGMGSQVRVSLVPFSDTALTIYSGRPDLDSDADGTPDLAEQLASLDDGGGTGYTAALSEVQTQLGTYGSGKNIVFFISDGEPTDGNGYLATAATIRGMGQGGTTLRAIGTGTGAQENTLDILDDGIDNNSAIIVMNPEELDASLLNTSVFEVAESAWIEIYRDGTLVDLIGQERFKVGPLGIGFESTAIALGASGTSQITAKLMTLDANGAMIETAMPIQIGAFVSNDTLVGGIGNDTMNGGAGTDSMVGGIGDDRYFVDNAGDITVEAAGEGTDTVASSLASYTLGANFENLDLIGNAVRGDGNGLVNTLTGNDANNVLMGYAGNDSLLGGAGNDTLDGGLGNDTMTGGDGSDVYYVDSLSDYVVEASDAAGSDTVVASFNASLGGYVSGVSTSDNFYSIENLSLLSGSVATNAVGNDSANVLKGNSNANRLHGLDGNDTLDGGSNIDTMDGGAGNDTYVVDNAGDVIVDISGTETVITSLNGYVLGAGLEQLTLANVASALSGTGNSGHNRIVGNTFANILNGGAGADTMAGGAGDDIYYVDHSGDQVVESAGAGVDKVYSSISTMLANNVETLVLTGTGGTGGAGNTLANTIFGNAGANRLLGNGGNDALLGNAGGDTLIGGLGKDVLTGGADNDVFVFTSQAETGITSATWDLISDFAAGDKINLSAIDANTATIANDAFSSVFVSAFTAAGQLKYDAVSHVLYGNTDANIATAEFAIEIRGINPANAAYFVL